MAKSAKRRPLKAIGVAVVLVMLAGGLLLGTQSSLSIERDEAGSVTAMNAWRFAGVPLSRRSVTGLREVRLMPMDLSARDLQSTAYQLVAGRDPLSGAPRKVKPLPPACGAAVFVGAIVLLMWFFTAGHRGFGPLAARTVQALMQSASQDDAAGLTAAVKQGVFVDARDGQDLTSLMLAARTGAGRASTSRMHTAGRPCSSRPPPAIATRFPCCSARARARRRS